MHVVAVKRLTRSQRRSRIEDPLFASELDAHGPSFNFLQARTSRWWLLSCQPHPIASNLHRLFRKTLA
ncbi:hypothetical protein UNPA324_17490 [Bradyrhizobium sp. UNPA324]|nr:hypothetical protein UNPA324_17490 [Bradyrhizobium sp. UNPA324]